MTTKPPIATIADVDWNCSDYGHIECGNGKCLVGRLACDGINQCCDSKTECLADYQSELSTDENFSTCPAEKLEIEAVSIKTSEFSFRFYPYIADYTIILENKGQVHKSNH